MNEPKLTFATGKRYDTRFLLDGVVRVRDFDITYPDIGTPPSPFFHSMVTELPYDIGEQAFAHYLLAKDQGQPLTAIPVFPSRFFPHFGVSVHREAGIASPHDLVGKRVAAPDFGYNPAVWMRSILTHQYEVPIEKIIWVEDEAQPFFRGLFYPRPRRFQIEQAQVPSAHRRYHGMRELLHSGAVDAVFLAGEGMPSDEASLKLFDDPYAEIRDYVATTGIFPINTLVTVKDAVVKAHPKLPARLMETFDEAQRLYRAELQRGAEPDHMGLRSDALAEMSLFPTEYGVEPNRAAIRLMIQYCYEQGLIRTLFEPEDLFADTTMRA